ncbi:TetR family transcriptional regulator [Novosphingobium endophyticum]|uniref:TetR family transcriptional regulator n=1 Tax=Novosphingobium endophyticum TaxID=1955250 RepID=A0A916TNS8_9SPHN|nr:TetR/AcrR family transcriptional regulator [Novosphingobium endophyticum]GGB85766.1 TetR family transcriptional regulator [Novosphingobium endophyticum]
MIANPRSRSVQKKAHPQGRPTADRATEIDQAILGAALEQFLDHGFEGATIEGVAKQARVSKGTVYARFPGKDALFRQVIEHSLATWSVRAGQFDHDKPDDLAGRLRFHAWAFKRMFCSRDVKRFTRMMERASDQFPELAAFWLARGSRRYRELVARDLADAGGPDAGEVQWTFVADMFLHALSGWLRTESLVRELGEDEVTRYIEKLVETVMRSMGRNSDTTI